MEWDGRVVGGTQRLSIMLRVGQVIASSRSFRTLLRRPPPFALTGLTFLGVQSGQAVNRGVCHETIASFVVVAARGAGRIDRRWPSRKRTALSCMIATRAIQPLPRDLALPEPQLDQRSRAVQLKVL